LLVPRKPVPQTTRRGVETVVAELESKLPGRWNVVVASRTTDGGSIRVTAPDGMSAEVAILVARNPNPRTVDALGRTERPAILVAAWLSPRTRERLQAAGWGYVDATGNVLVTLDQPGLFVSGDGAARNPSPAPAPGVGLRGPRAWALQRTLVEVLPPYGVTDLAETLRIDAGYVSRLLNGLAEELLITRPERGPVEAVEWEAMLRQLATSYSLLEANETTQWLAPGGAEQFLRDVSASKLRTWAVSGSFAAAQLVSVTAPEVAVVYADDPKRLADATRLRPVRNGGNVVTARPYDPIVFERTWERDKLRFVSLAQVVMDCSTGFGRMPAEADALVDWMRTRAPRWQAPSLTERAALP
jgi:hypothetical protein